MLDIDPNEEEKLVQEAQDLREQGNKQFRDEKDFEKALDLYLQAAETCPPTRKDLLALYWGNVSACRYQLQLYKETVEACDKALEFDDTHIKVRIRRINANEKLATWSALEDAVADLRKLQELESTTPEQKAQYELQVQRIMPTLKIKQQEETEKMMGKLKDMGNSFLGHFGLSLDNFKMNQTPEGGYTMNYDQ